MRKKGTKFPEEKKAGGRKRGVGERVTLGGGQVWKWVSWYFMKHVLF